MISILLVGVIVLLIIDRYIYTRDVHKKLDDMVKALLSRNIDDYIHAKAIDKKLPITNTEPDYTPLDQTNDDEFDELIEKINQ